MDQKMRLLPRAGLQAGTIRWRVHPLTASRPSWVEDEEVSSGATKQVHGSAFRQAGYAEDTTCTFTLLTFMACYLHIFIYFP